MNTYKIAAISPLGTIISREVPQKALCYQIGRLVLDVKKLTPMIPGAGIVVTVTDKNEPEKGSVEYYMENVLKIAKVLNFFSYADVIQVMHVAGSDKNLREAFSKLLKTKKIHVEDETNHPWIYSL